METVTPQGGNWHPNKTGTMRVSSMNSEILGCFNFTVGAMG